MNDGYLHILIKLLSYNFYAVVTLTQFIGIIRIGGLVRCTYRESENYAYTICK